VILGLGIAGCASGYAARKGATGFPMFAVGTTPALSALIAGSAATAERPYRKMCRARRKVCRIKARRAFFVDRLECGG